MGQYFLIDQVLERSDVKNVSYHLTQSTFQYRPELVYSSNHKHRATSSYGKVVSKQNSRISPVHAQIDKSGQSLSDRRAFTSFGVCDDHSCVRWKQNWAYWEHFTTKRLCTRGSASTNWTCYDNLDAARNRICSEFVDSQRTPKLAHKSKAERDLELKWENDWVGQRSWPLANLAIRKGS